MERCPNCRARWESGETCRRCGMDLGPLLTVERAAECLITRAVAELAAGQPGAAIHSLTSARALIADPLIGHLAAFAKTLSADPQGPGYSPSDLKRPWHGPG